MMKIKDFCELYNVSHQTVYDKIKAAKGGVLEGHVRNEKGKSMEIDDVAAEYLRPKPRKAEALIAELNDVKDTVNAVKDTVEEVIQKTAENDIKMKNDHTEIHAFMDNLSERIDALEKMLEKYIKISEERYTILTGNDKQTADRLGEISGKVSELSEKVMQASVKKGIFG